MLIVGGVVSEELLTVTETSAVAVFPAASRPVAASVCAPLAPAVVFHEKFHGAAVAVPIHTPALLRSGERRGGEEGRSRWAADPLKKKKDTWRIEASTRYS